MAKSSRKTRRTQRIQSAHRINAIKAFKPVDTIDIAYAALESIDTPTSLGIYMRLKAGMFDEALRRSVHPRDYADAAKFDLDYQACSLLSKSQLSIRTPEQRAAMCYMKSIANDERLRDYNESFDMIIADLTVDELDVLTRARKLIKKTLNKFDSEEFFACFRFSDGTSAGGARQPIEKLSCLEVTTEASVLLTAVLSTLSAGSSFFPFSDHQPVIIEDEKAQTVPKGWDIDRPIGIQPSGNLSLQLAIGQMLRRRMATGPGRIDLNNQWKKNSDASRRASLSGRVATLDKRAASASVYTAYVNYMFALCDKTWFHIMDEVRCKSERYENNTSRQLQRFAAMGNGFMFELQSLLFWAVACSIPGVRISDVLIFGDDLILPAAFAAKYMSLMTKLGMQFNENKTFVDTEFRESCGGHYFRGINVKPLYIRQGDTCDLASYINLCNRIILHRSSDANVHILDGWRKRLWKKLITRIDAGSRELLSSPYPTISNQRITFPQDWDFRTDTSWRRDRSSGVIHSYRLLTERVVQIPSPYVQPWLFYKHLEKRYIEYRDRYSSNEQIVTMPQWRVYVKPSLALEWSPCYVDRSIARAIIMI